MSIFTSVVILSLINFQAARICIGAIGFCYPAVVLSVQVSGFTCWDNTEFTEWSEYLPCGKEFVNQLTQLLRLKVLYKENTCTQDKYWYSPVRSLFFRKDGLLSANHILVVYTKVTIKDNRKTCPPHNCLLKFLSVVVKSRACLRGKTKATIYRAEWACRIRGCL